jgi:hypothetical protein
VFNEEKDIFGNFENFQKFGSQVQENTNTEPNYRSLEE